MVCARPMVRRPNFCVEISSFIGVWGLGFRVGEGKKCATIGNSPEQEVKKGQTAN